MNVDYIKQNSALAGKWDHMNWYFLEGDLYIEGNGPLDLTCELEFHFGPDSYTKDDMRMLPIKYPWASVKEQIVRLRIAEGCTAIREQSFYGHKNLQEIFIPEGVKEIGWRAFAYCESLAYIELPYGLEEITEQAFIGCVSLRRITIPSSVKVIGKAAFGICVNLEELVIPESVTEIREQAFQGCISLRFLSLPAGLKKIGASAFLPCRNLEQVIVPKSVEEIGSGAFYEATQVICEE